MEIEGDPFAEVEAQMALLSHGERGGESSELTIDSATTHTILKNRALFSYLAPAVKREITTITGTYTVSSQYGPAQIRLPQGTRIKARMALYSPDATCNSGVQGHFGLRIPCPGGEGEP